MSIDLGKLFFTFCGYFSEGMNFPDKSGNPVYMARYDYLGNNVVLPITQEEYANLPAEGTLVRVEGVIKGDKKTGKIALNVHYISIQGRDGDFKAPTQAELMAGVVFGGDVLVSLKKSGIYEGLPYRNVTIALFGVSYRFSFANDEQMFNQFPESGVISIAGKVDTVVSSVQPKDGGKAIRVCENILIPERIAKAQPEKPVKQPAA